MTSAPPAFALPDLLSWIEDAHAQLLLADPAIVSRLGFAHEFISYLAESIPEVSLHTATANLECLQADGEWVSVSLTERSFVVPRFEQQWIFHGGVASESDLNGMMSVLMHYIVSTLVSDGQSPDRANHLRVTPLRFAAEPSTCPRLLILPYSKMVLAILGGHRDRHLQAHTLENQTPAATGRGMPPRI